MENAENNIWLGRLRRREHDAFTELVQRHEQQVFLCCYSLGLNVHECEDVANETFLAAWKSIESFSGESKVSTWLWSIAYHKTMDFLRKQGQAPETVCLDEHMAEYTGPGGKLEAEQQSEIIWSAVKELPKPWTLAVVLFYREEKSISDIAQIMEIPENTVKIYLYRARNKLKESLNCLWKDGSQCI